MRSLREESRSLQFVGLVNWSSLSNNQSTKTNHCLTIALSAAAAAVPTGYNRSPRRLSFILMMS